MTKQTDDGNFGDFGAHALLNTPPVLRQLIEVGRVWIADFTDEYRVFLDASVEAIQGDSDLKPFAVLPAGKQSWAVANLMAALISETWPRGPIDLPAWFNDDLKFAGELLNDDEPGADGNVGTVSDSINVQIVGADGRALQP